MQHGIKLLLAFPDAQQWQYVAIAEVVVAGDAHTGIARAYFPCDPMNGVAPVLEYAGPIRKPDVIKLAAAFVAIDCVNIGQ